MKRTYKRALPIALGIGIVLTGIVGVHATEAGTRTNVKTTNNETLSSSTIPTQYKTPEYMNRSDIENQFREKSYSFALGLGYVDFEDKVAYKDEKAAKERLKTALNFLEDLTGGGNDFTAVEGLQFNDEWSKFIEDIAILKYEDLAESEILNDLNVAGALILQSEGHYDEPSLRYLYQVISDLNSGVNGESVKYEVTKAFGDDSFEEIQQYLKSKI